MKLNNIKNSFENRRIEPSANAWDQLESRLDQEEKKSKKPVLFWLGAIAAILILGVFIYPMLSSDIVIKEDLSNEVVIDQTKTEHITNENKETEILVAPTTNDPLKNTNSSLEALATNEENNNNSKATVKQKNKENIKIEDTGVTLPDSKKNTAISFADHPEKTFIEDSSIDPAITVEVVEASTKKLTAEEEMELLLNEAIKKVETKEYAVKDINIDQLVRETEWDIEADRRNRFNNYLYDQLGKLKKEAVATITGRK
ncbi:hypothetical protein LX97_01546 [Nonlabens dokdonensis]|uniref:Uncharacterized protein n=2 Tax=Nonlabens dokdonensis TaxID=328515 RepID=L7WAU4_NONDD|nr:hypothetical protein [Nonlabens dokdonensis]AGC77239.1 hypothetical protein DDD_2112 [Nonlabens dokdonensis DSW-6]PZX40774.1 hypothetical protein LX97_01546 [Nonlabens dokdonensis]